ncbi:MAG: phage major capsid protein [bacterium]
MAHKSIQQMLAAAFKAITVSDLDDSTLVPEQADRFLRVMRRRTVILPNARRITMMADTRNIDRTGFSGRLLDAPQSEGEVFTGETKPDFFTNQLVAQKTRGRASISDESLEENIEREGFESTLVDMIAESAGIDLEELFIQGDEGSGDDFLALTDGWLVKAEQQLDGTTDTDFDADDVEDMFEQMILAVDEKYISGDRSRWRIFTTFEAENAYRDVLRARETSLGDTAQVGQQPLFYKGIRVRDVPNMPSGSSLLTNLDNTVYGIRRDIEIEPERRADADRWDFHVRAKGDAHYEDENAAVHAHDSDF